MKKSFWMVTCILSAALHQGCGGFPTPDNEFGDDGTGSIVSSITGAPDNVKCIKFKLDDTVVKEVGPGSWDKISLGKIKIGEHRFLVLAYDERCADSTLDDYTWTSQEKKVNIKANSKNEFTVDMEPGGTREVFVSVTFREPNPAARPASVLPQTGMDESTDSIKTNLINLGYGEKVISRLPEKVLSSFNCVRDVTNLQDGASLDDTLYGLEFITQDQFDKKLNGAMLQVKPKILVTCDGLILVTGQFTWEDNPSFEKLDYIATAFNSDLFERVKDTAYFHVYYEGTFLEQYEDIHWTHLVDSLPAPNESYKYFDERVEGYQVTIGEADLGAVKNHARFTLGDFSIGFSEKLSGHADAAHFSNTVTFGFPLSHHNDFLDGLTRFGDYFVVPVLEKPTEYRCATPRGPDDEKLPCWWRTGRVVRKSAGGGMTGFFSYQIKLKDKYKINPLLPATFATSYGHLIKELDLSQWGLGDWFALLGGATLTGVVGGATGGTGPAVLGSLLGGAGISTTGSLMNLWRDHFEGTENPLLIKFDLEKPSE